MTSTPTTYLVHFERIGRNHDVPSATFTAADADQLAGEIHRYARPNLRSSEVEVIVDLEKLEGRILVGGFRPAGSFTISVSTP